MNKEIKLKKIENKIRQIINLSKRQIINLSSDEELDDIPNDFIDFKNLSKTNINLSAEKRPVRSVGAKQVKEMFKDGSWSEDSIMGYYGGLTAYNRSYDKETAPIVIFSSYPRGTDFKNEYKDEIGNEYLLYSDSSGRNVGTFFVEDLVSISDIVNGKVKVKKILTFK